MRDTNALDPGGTMTHQHLFAGFTAAGFALLFKGGLSLFLYRGYGKVDWKSLPPSDSALESMNRGAAKFDYRTRIPFTVVGSVLFAVGVVGLVAHL